MKRRSYLKNMAAAGVAAAFPGLAQTASKSIQLHVDLSVDPGKEKEMLDIFHGQFGPAAAKQPGFIDARMVKLRKALQGSAPSGANYRFVLSVSDGRAAPALDCNSHPPEAVADNREHAFLKGLHGIAIRRGLECTYLE